MLRFRFIPLLSCTYLLVLVLATAASAQTFRGGINGSVTDVSGAAIPDAAVQTVNDATGVIHSTVSSSAGEYSFEDLPLGTYTVTVTASGFQTLKVDRVPVSAGALYSLPLKVSVAAQATTVEVDAAGLALDTTTTTQTTVIPNRTVSDIPLNGRDYTQLIALTPGFSGYAGGASGSINGARANQVNWQIEGSDNNDQWWNIMAVNQGGVQSIAGVVLPLDAVEEFSLQTQAGPETGRNPGGTVNIVIKSGTNQLHGSAYYYNRNEALAAETPFAPAGSAKNKLRNQQYGFSTGGPIIRDHTFFFVTYEEQKFLIGNQAQSTEPSVAYQQSANQVLQFYGLQENPVSATLLGTIWPGSALTGAAAPNNYFNPNAESGFSHNGLIKLDHNFNENNRLSFRWFVGQGTQTAPIGSHLSYYYQVAPIHVQNYSLVYNTTFSPRLSNQALIGVSYFNQVFSDANHSFNPVSLGLNTGVTGSNLIGAPLIAITGFDSTGLTPNSGRNDITGHLEDALSYSIGKHQMRFGGEIRQAQVDSFYNTGARGAFYFNGTAGPWSADYANADGSPNCAGYFASSAAIQQACQNGSFDYNVLTLADFMAGDVYQSTIVRGNQERQVFLNSFTLFAQDAWQTTRRLNLNYGLRYDYEGPLHTNYADVSVFDPSKGGLVVAGAGISSLYPKIWTNLSPRLGLAFQPKEDGDLVIRAGFGLFFDTPAIVPFLDNSSSLAAASTANNGPIGVEGNPAGINPVYTIQENGYIIQRNTPLFPNGNLSIGGSNVFNLFSVSQNFRTAYDLSYNLNVEKGLGKNVVLQVGYVGTLGRRLLSLRDINQAALGSGFNTSEVTTPSGNVFSFQQASRPYFSQFPNFGVIDEIQSIGTSSYNGLQTTLRTTSWHGLISQFNYTYAHSLDEVTQYVGALPQDSTNFYGDYGNSDYDIRRHFNSYLIYDIPGSSHGPRWLSHGWQANGNISFRTGEPFSIHASSDTSGTAENTDRGVQIGAPFSGVSHALVNHQPVQWINPAAYTNAPDGSFGTVARNSVVGPGYGDVDLSIFKNTTIHESIRTQFRVEIFNLFNRTNLAPPAGTIGGGFGQSSDTIGDYSGSPGIGPGEPFNVQLALKILF
jgi:Carboxypeptidase regulatory-like domain/TonB dependent receptor